MVLAVGTWSHMAIRYVMSHTYCKTGFGRSWIRYRGGIQEEDIVLYKARHGSEFENNVFMVSLLCRHYSIPTYFMSSHNRVSVGGRPLLTIVQARQRTGSKRKLQKSLCASAAVGLPFSQLHLVSTGPAQNGPLWRFVGALPLRA